MKALATLSLFLCLSNAFAAQKYGGISFDSSVLEFQSYYMKNDIRYLFENPVSQPDTEFLAVTGLKSGSGDHLHNWILNRVRYVVGEYFDYESKLSSNENSAFIYPKTALPDGVNANQIDNAQTVMSNLGGAIYIYGKIDGTPISIELDDLTLPIESPRSGLLQIGSGLFVEDLLINKSNKLAASNSISRMGTFFHEARHSDGNGRSAGFMHSKCPNGHSYEGLGACEISGNGSYTVGGLALRHMLNNCKKCSTEEKIILSTSIADSFDRIFDVDKVLKRATLESEIRGHKSILRIFTTSPSTNLKKEQVDAEIESLKKKIASMEAKLAEMNIKPDSKPNFLDVTPEGNYKEISLSESVKLMKGSLKK